jgi:hypothetical protein
MSFHCSSLVCIYDIFTPSADSTVSVVVMEHLPGGSLLATIKGKLLTPTIINTTIISIVFGLGYLYGHGFVHRGLDPSSVFFTGDGFAKIALGPGEKAPRHLPEAEVSFASDMWALASTIYAMIEGCPLRIHAELSGVMEACWKSEPTTRPTIGQIAERFAVAGWVLVEGADPGSVKACLARASSEAEVWPGVAENSPMASQGQKDVSELGALRVRLAKLEAENAALALECGSLRAELELLKPAQPEGPEPNDEAEPRSSGDTGAVAFTNGARAVVPALQAEWTNAMQLSLGDPQQVKSLVLPAGVLSIANSALQGLVALEAVTIPKGCASIGNSAFSGCLVLRRIVIPAWCAIGNGAFNGCIVLADVTIGRGCSIGRSAFYGCARLATVVVPEDCAVDKDAFRGCPARVTRGPPEEAPVGAEAASAPGEFVLVDGSRRKIPPWEVEWTKATSQTALGDTKLVMWICLPGGVTAIGESAFQGAIALQSVVIPEGCQAIGCSAFGGCLALRGIVVPARCTSIGNGAFNGCVALSQVTIPEGTSIGRSAFASCTALLKLKIPASCTLDEDALRMCSARVMRTPAPAGSAPAATGE